MNTIEIELRYKILDPKQLPAFVAPLQLLHEKHDVDVYLDTPHALLYQKGIFVRIRNDKKFDIKFNRACLDNPFLESQDYCEEHSFRLPLQTQDLITLNPLLASLNLKPIFDADLGQLKESNNLGTDYIVSKFRKSYTGDMFTIAIDEVEELGTFLEIELMASNIENLVSTKQRMKQLLDGLSLEPLRTGYCTLLLREQRFEYYLQGRFILEEDKVYRDKILLRRNLSAVSIETKEFTFDRDKANTR